MYACCKEGVASNRCVKLPTMSPLSHLWIDVLRGAEVRVRIWTTLAPPCLLLQALWQRVGLPEHTVLWMGSFQLSEKLCAHLGGTNMDLRQTICP